MSNAAQARQAPILFRQTCSFLTSFVINRRVVNRAVDNIIAEDIVHVKRSAAMHQQRSHLSQSLKKDGAQASVLAFFDKSHTAEAKSSAAEGSIKEAG
ncbi:MAG: hypothetical protein II697_00205 [Clostridia bacterium]|nr:hypothetical protein [Clostridia bacterium]